MISLRVPHLLSMLIIVAATACAPQPQNPPPPPAMNAAGFIMHDPSGMRFPDRVDDFRRGRMIRYDKEGRDVSAGYDSVNPAMPIVATVYVYPAPPLTSIGSSAEVIASARERLCQDEFRRRKAELVAYHADARLIAEQDISLLRGYRQFPGKQARYEFSGSIRGVQSQISSELYVFCYVGEKWAVEYRFSWPRDVAAAPSVAAFIADLPWTILAAP
jgi:hypothetical protein